MKITQCSDKTAWDAWYTSRTHAEFLQSWEWGEFQASTGKVIHRLQIYSDTHIADQALGIVHDLGFGVRYLYVPRWEPQEKKTYGALCAYARMQGYVFVRVEPVTFSFPASHRFRATVTRQPQDEWTIDVSQTEETLQNAMHSKTRYNIRLAERKGVIVEQRKDSQIFWRLNTQTRDRDNFKTHDQRYYNTLLDQPFTQQYIAVFHNEPVASILCIRFGDTMTYVHGASSNEYRNVMAPYALQWHAMRDAKKQGVHWYSLGGVSPAASRGMTTTFHGYTWDPTHRFSGITRFKVGFGGAVRQYAPAKDAVLRSCVYTFYKLARKIKGYG